MIGRRSRPSAETEAEKPRGFDDYDLRLGDVMRGERATLAKSLLDVQRDLRIKASYISAIEHADITAFPTPSFVAGYVRSYARYLGMDPDWAFERFCRESGFEPTHGMAPAASGPKPQRRPSDPAEALANPDAIFVPKPESLLSRIEPRAMGSVLVLALLAGGLGYGGWTVFQEVQRVQLAPVDQAPGVVAELDPVESAVPLPAEIGLAEAVEAPPAFERLDRLYRPQALDVPVLTARDGPIASIDPNRTGLLAGTTGSGVAGGRGRAPGQQADVQEETRLAEAEPAETGVRTIAPDAPELEIFAVRPSWVRVRSADGTVILEKILDGGESFEIPAMEAAPRLRVGESGALYFAVNGVPYGPAGASGSVTRDIELAPEALTDRYAAADLDRDRDLARYVALAEAAALEAAED